MESAIDRFFDEHCELVFMHEPEGEGLMGEGRVIGAFIAFEDRLRHPGSHPNQADETLIYDWVNDMFLVGSPNDFWERHVASIRRDRDPFPDAPDTDECEQCGAVFPIDDGNNLCENCRPRLPIWHPNYDEPLVAMLRSIEGHPLAVHLIEPDHNTARWNKIVDSQGPVLAFSIPQTEDHFIASLSWGDRDEPYSVPWATVLDAFINKKMIDLYVSGRGDSYHSNPNVAIEREMFQRLYVAMDAFMETGMTHQPTKEFLKIPPVLWTCDQINEIVWHEERGESVVEAFVATYDEKGTIQTDLSVWSARTPELNELIDDGFIQWKNDRSVRDYLHRIGVCRQK